MTELAGLGAIIVSAVLITAALCREMGTRRYNYRVARLLEEFDKDRDVLRQKVLDMERGGVLQPRDGKGAE